jgi:transposase
MDCTQRYELIRPILQGDKIVRQVAKESGISIRTLYRYLSRFTESGEKISSLADKSHAAHSHPNWFTDEHKAIVIDYKQKHPHTSEKSHSIQNTIQRIVDECGEFPPMPNQYEG